MVFSSYNNASYLPLDNDQGVSFYKNENLLYQSAAAAAVSPPSTLVCRRNTAMITESSPFGSSQPLLAHHHGSDACDDFQPVAHLSSNGYYGYVPPANSMPKMMSTSEQQGTLPAVATAASTTNGNGVGVPLDSHHPVAGSVVDSNFASTTTMMDCGGDIGGVGNYYNNHHHQQQEQRKRKEYSEEEEVEGNCCKRRKTWLQPNDTAGFSTGFPWPQQNVQHMECHNQPMDTFPLQHFNGSPVTMNAGTTALNGFQFYHQQHQALATAPPMPAAPQPQAVLQPKNRLIGACSPSPMSPPPLLLGPELAEKPIHHHRQNHHPKCFGDNCQEVEDLFINLHGSGFYLAC